MDYTSATQASRGRGLRTQVGRSLPSNWYGRPEPPNDACLGGARTSASPLTNRTIVAPTTHPAGPSSAHQETPRKSLAYTIERRPLEQESIKLPSFPPLTSRSSAPPSRAGSSFARQLYASSLPKRQTVTVDNSTSSVEVARPQPHLDRHNDPPLVPEIVEYTGNVHSANILVLSPASPRQGDYAEQNNFHVTSPSESDAYPGPTPLYSPTSGISAPCASLSSSEYPSDLSATGSSAAVSYRRSSTRLNGPREPSVCLYEVAQRPDLTTESPSAFNVHLSMRSLTPMEGPPQEQAPSYSLVDGTLAAPDYIHSHERRAWRTQSASCSTQPTSSTHLSRAPTYYLVDPRSSISTLSPAASPNPNLALNGTVIEGHGMPYYSGPLSGGSVQNEMRPPVSQSTTTLDFSIHPDQQRKNGYEHTDVIPVSVPEYHFTVPIATRTLDDVKRAPLHADSRTAPHISSTPSKNHRHHHHHPPPPPSVSDVDTASLVSSSIEAPPSHASKLQEPSRSRSDGPVPLRSLPHQPYDPATQQGVYQLPIHHQQAFPTERVEPARRPQQSTLMYHQSIPSQGVHQIPIYHEPMYQEI
ncbi:hypothetical protein F5I97DRAFT_1831698 [Phlebopus sp. FC_14]|nr:hypothetical protein F5I97DRAFT_1831698 [Phlebopus sp. FC_14]